MAYFRLLITAILSVSISHYVNAECEPHEDENSYQRVITIGGDVTEIVYALGCENKLIAVDSGSLYPKEALKDHPNVGYLRTLSAEPILALAPDLIIAIEEVEPRIILEQLKESGVDVVIVPDEKSMAGIYNKVQAISNALAVNDAGTQLINSIKNSYQEIQEKIHAMNTRPSIAFVLQGGHGAPMVAGRDTSADKILELSGGVNAFDQFSGYKPINAESMIKQRPDYILVTERTLKEIGSREKILDLPAFKHALNFDEKRLLVMEDLLLLGFGPRTPLAINQLAGMIHPE